jgi:hypothetical protein
LFNPKIQTLIFFITKRKFQPYLGLNEQSNQSNVKTIEQRQRPFFPEKFERQFG